MSGNRPGLGAVSYRLGTYTEFRRRILDQIASAVVDGSIPASGLRALLTRRDDDYAITVVDLWAAVAEILSFYQERYANETFLRTAQAAESVIGLAALANPGLSATAATAGTAAVAQLLFTVAPGPAVTIPAGLRVQSQGGAPQVFETFTDVVASPSLNRLRIHPELQDQGGFSGTTVVLDPMLGPKLSAELKAGASVVVYTMNAVEEKTVAAVTVAEDRVTVTWKSPVELTTPATAAPALTAPVLKAPAHAYRRLRAMRLFGWNSPASYAVPRPPKQAGADGAPPPPTRLRKVKWQLVQLQAKDYAYPCSSTTVQCSDAEQPAPMMGCKQARFCLDGVYPGLASGQKILVADLAGVGNVVLYDVQEVDQTTDAFGALSGPVTRVWAAPAAGGGPQPIGDRRQVVIYELAGDEIVPAASVDKSTWSPAVHVDGRKVDGHGDRIEVGLTIAGGQFQPGVVVSVGYLPAGRQLVLADVAGGAPQPVRLASAATISAPPPPPGMDDDGLRRLLLTLDAAPNLDLATAVAMGNLGPASHGETVTGEVLGSSTGAPFQTFTLKRQPLAYVTTPDGRTESSLHVLVDGVEWREVPALAGRQPSDAVFTTRPGDGGSVVVAFGDGVAGRVPPAGRSNVTATYRVGGGQIGNVAAGTLTSLLDRPTGLLTVTNPLPAAGGLDGGSADTVRASVGAAVRTVGRAVSGRDFEDVVRQTAGVAGAAASIVQDGAGPTISVAVTADGGSPLAQAVKDRIAGALAGRFDPTFAVRVNDAVSPTPFPVPVHARLTLRADALRSQVQADATRAIGALFAFGAVAPGRAPDAGAVTAALQRVTGVAGVALIDYRPAVTAGAIPVAGQLTLDLAGGLAGER